MGCLKRSCQSSGELDTVFFLWSALARHRFLSLECVGSTPLSFFGVRCRAAAFVKFVPHRKKESGVEPPHSKGSRRFGCPATDLLALFPFDRTKIGSSRFDFDGLTKPPFSAIKKNGIRVLNEKAELANWSERNVEFSFFIRHRVVGVI